MAKGKQSTKQPKAKQVQAPRGQIGLQTYEDVRKIVDAKGVPLVRAFDEVAKATGRKASTIAVTYYTISKKKRGGAGSKGSSAKMAKAAGLSANERGKGTLGSVQSILSGITAAISKLEVVIAQQGQEIERLQGESKLANQLRKLLQE